ncbi:ribonuclease P protein component [Patescibacteria group bacterium]|nr:ribonuclease P protein component [Patescibacteria group bacterium]
MLAKTHRLRRMRDFALLSQKGRVVYGPFFTLRFRASQEPTKIGFVVSTKLYKRAHDRNRTKRRLREAVRLIQASWPDKQDILLIARPEAKDAPFEEIKTAILHAFEKMPEAALKPIPKRKPKAKKKTSVVFKDQKSQA